MRYTQSVGFGVEASEVVTFLWTPVLGEAERISACQIRVCGPGSSHPHSPRSLSEPLES